MTHLCALYDLWNVCRDPAGSAGEETLQNVQCQEGPQALAAPLHPGQQPLTGGHQEALPASVEREHFEWQRQVQQRGGEWKGGGYSPGLMDTWRRWLMQIFINIQYWCFVWNVQQAVFFVLFLFVFWAEIVCLFCAVISLPAVLCVKLRLQSGRKAIVTGVIFWSRITSIIFIDHARHMMLCLIVNCRCSICSAINSECVFFPPIWTDGCAAMHCNLKLLEIVFICRMFQYLWRPHCLNNEYPVSACGLETIECICIVFSFICRHCGV